MIHNLKISNFYSIKDEQNISFVSDKKEPSNYTFLDSANEKISKLNLFIGSNASGKTNVLKSFAFIKWLICDSFNTKPNTELPFKTFFNSKENSMFEIQFAINSDLFTYEVEFTQKRIIKESLSQNSLVNARRTNKELFTRRYNDNISKYEFLDSDLPFTKSHGDVLERQNTSALAIGVQFLDPISLKISEYWRKVNTNVFETGYDGNNPFEIMGNLISFHVNPEEKTKVENVLQRFDLGFDSLEILTEQDNQTTTINGAHEVHVFENAKFANDLSYASNGTKRLLLIIRYILFAIQNKVPLIFDELEAFLHPEILREIVDMFIDDEVESQLIFTSHSLSIMNKLDKNQIFLAEKKLENGSTEVFKLNEIPNVRSEDNFYNKYIAGAYGAIPRL